MSCRMILKKKIGMSHFALGVSDQIICWIFSFQVDASAVNLRLQYSSYFLFVMVITCVLYGMIKGRPVKQNFNKKVHGTDS